jgi:hypothetical protein
MWHKVIISIVLLTGMLFSCTPGKQISKTPPKPEKIELVANGQDSTEYELVIIDPGFQSWFDMNRKPVWYYTKDYLASWNYQYVVAWNARVRDPLFAQSRANNPFILEIDYRPAVDYGIDLNYKLYHYFKYIEATWGRILPYDRQN